MDVPYDTWHSVHRTKAHPGDNKENKTMTADYKWRTLSATGLKRLWKRYVACKFDAENPKCKHLNDDYNNIFDTWLGKQNYTIKKDKSGKIEKCYGEVCKEIEDKDYTTFRSKTHSTHFRSKGGTRRFNGFKKNKKWKI